MGKIDDLYEKHDFATSQAYKDHVIQELVAALHEYLAFSTMRDLMKLIAEEL